MDDPTTRILLNAEGNLEYRVRGLVLEIAAPDGGPRSTRRVHSLALTIGSADSNDLVLTDPSVSRLHAELRCTDTGFQLRDLGSRNGTRVDNVLVRDATLPLPRCVIRIGQTTITAVAATEDAPISLYPGTTFGTAIGESAKMRALFAQLAKIANSQATVLLEGETGTGKDVLARAIHANSNRSKGPFVVLDCASIPANLFESELMGVVKGAFTGADRDRMGALESADGGTLFLDEIGELPLDLQPKLLRATERREVKRVGSVQSVPVDVRLICATHRDLAAAVNARTFREDLYFRLAVFRAHVPALRERPEDIEPMLRHFARTLFDPAPAAQLIEQFTPEQLQRLRAHTWPGNVRELRNIIERMQALGEATPATFASAPASTNAELQVDLSRPLLEQKNALVDAFESAYLQRMLAKHDGQIGRAAEAAGIDRVYYRRLLKKLGIVD